MILDMSKKERFTKKRKRERKKERKKESTV
jgi:hypothetical protein